MSTSAAWPIPLSYPPMEAETRDELPVGDNWAYEPKWDGFRCIAFRDDDAVELMSKRASRWRATSRTSSRHCAT